MAKRDPWVPWVYFSRRPGNAAGIAVGTLVKRSILFMLIWHVADAYYASSVEEVMRKAIATKPEKLAKSVTWDQGSEMARHADFAIATGIPVFFCEPHSPKSEGPVRTPMAYFTNTCPRAPTYQRSWPTTS
jgi:IS30 family transposase